MLYGIEEASKAGVAFTVLDRPNPITGTRVEGPMLDAALNSNVGCYDLPVRHGMTLGEIATMANTERKWNAKLQVVKMENWSRDEWFDQTGLPWVDPSPNMRSLNAATLYPGIALLETQKDYSVGRGTDAPFEQIGASWINGEQLSAALNARSIPGISVYPVRFQDKHGVRFVVTDRTDFDAVRFGLELAVVLRTLYPNKLDFEASRNLIGNRGVVDALKSQPITSILGLLNPHPFTQRRDPFLLY
jgi:uncharacterized protein YbbC (DUF1343 family)